MNLRTWQQQKNLTCQQAADYLGLPLQNYLPMYYSKAKLWPWIKRKIESEMKDD